MYDFILGNLKLGNWQKGITTAASWAWGVSVIVGIQVFQQKGIEAFAIWAAANSLTLALLGWLFTRVQHGTLKLAAVVPAWSRPLMSSHLCDSVLLGAGKYHGYKDSVLHAGR